MLRIKVFAWLTFSDRLNTRDMLRRRNWNVTNVYTCALCPCNVTEDWMHLFFQCNFSLRIWNYLQIEWQQADSMEQVFFLTKRSFNKPFFTEVVILASWHIWKHRNDVVFSRIQPSFRAWRRAFLHEASLHVHRMKSKHADQWSRWIDSLL